MILGIDYGTTRTVVAAADRGNYPVVSFQTESGDTQEWYPSLVAANDRGELLFGFDAAAKQSDPDWHLLRSFKRQLGTLGPESPVRIGGRDFPALELLTAHFAQLRRDLVARSNLRARKQTAFEAMISVPANSNSNQRFLTIEAFRRANFEVRGVINEPSAAGIEYAHHQLQQSSAGAAREYVVVYDLGGGTFDASLIGMAERRHQVISSDGVAQLGGDDFDRALLELALERAEVNAELGEDERARLLEECREKKEGLHPNTRKVAIDLGRVIDGADEVSVGTAEFYERAQPLVEQTIEAMERAAAATTSGGEAFNWRAEVAAIYLVGGSSDLPAVARTLRERYGRLVRKSPYPHAAIAIGLAIAACADEGYDLRERFTRHFGVWREREAGRAIGFDVIFEKDTLLPEAPAEKLARTRRYLAAHNVGHFRYLECGRLDDAGHPVGEITFWDDIYFPLAPELREEQELERASVARRAEEAEGDAQMIEERYICDAAGIIEVVIANLTSGYQRKYKLRHK